MFCFFVAGYEKLNHDSSPVSKSISLLFTAGCEHVEKKLGASDTFCFLLSCQEVGAQRAHSFRRFNMLCSITQADDSDNAVPELIPGMFNPASSSSSKRTLTAAPLLVHDFRFPRLPGLVFYAVP